MQVLWREVFDGNCPLTVDEFLYCYKPSKISQSQGFYQFTARGLNYRLVKSLSTSDGNWKTEFFFITRIWARNHVVVGRDPFPPYTGKMGNHHPEGMTTMKENKEKGLADEETMQETHSQPCPVAGSLPSCQGHKKVKHGSSKSGVVKPGFVIPAETTSSKPTETTSSKHPKSTPMNFLENEDWERFQQAMIDEDVAMCDMSLKEFERSAIHDLFKAMFKFMAASKQATKMDHERVRLEARVREVQAECRHRAEVTAKVEEEVKELKNHVEELKNLVEELKADAVEKDTRLDHLQKRSDELCILFEKAKGEAIKEFKASSEFTNLMDENYAARFKDFCKDAIERFPEVDFSSIKLNVAAGSSFLQTSSKDVNIEDDASTQPAVDDPKFGENLLWFIKKESCNCFIYFLVSFILFYFIYYYFYV